MGCALSHLSLWQRLAVEPNPSASYLILEDDARLEPSWVRKVEEAFLSGSVPADWEVLYLGGILPQYRESFEQNVQPVNPLVARIQPDCIFGNNPPGYFHFCAYSYILSQRGARRLLNLLQSWNGFWLQADFVAAYHTPELSPPRRIYFLHPLIAESFQDTAQGLARPYDENQGQENQVDSDIWKNDDRFGPDEIAAIKTDGLPLDIPAALGWAPDDTLSLSASAPREQAADSAPVASSDSTTKKVGLICVTRNSADKLKVTLESIVRNTDPALFDLYVVDNGSTDSTAELCASAWSTNIHFIRKKENLGWVGGINSCLPEAKKHSFVGFLHDDIEVGPRWLEHLLNLIEWNKTVGAVSPLTSNDCDWQGYDRFRLGPVKPGLPELEGIDRQDVLQMATAMASFNPGVTLNDCVLAFFCVLIRIEIVEKIGLLDEAFNELYLGDDDDYCKRILATGQLLALSFNAYVAHHSEARSLAVEDYEVRYKKSQQIIAEKRKRGLYEPTRRLNLAALFPVKISLLHATRGRPEQADDARKLWLDRANKPERVEHIFALDHDDESSESLKKFHHVIQMQNGYSVGAWNLAAKHSTGDILMQMSDDWDPPAGWDDLVAGGLDISLERVLWVNEDYTRKDIMCMVILTRKYYEKHGLFDPRFKNVYSDDDFTARAKKLSAITYANNIVFKHKHFTTGDSAVDATFLRGNDHVEYHRAKILFDSIYIVAVIDES
jgi:GT2 family glycosyltransferase